MTDLISDDEPLFTPGGQCKIPGVSDEPIHDEDLPGMWTSSDFLGGDPDTRSYAQRERDREAGL